MENSYNIQKALNWSSGANPGRYTIPKSEGSSLPPMEASSSRSVEAMIGPVAFSNACGPSDPRGLQSRQAFRKRLFDISRSDHSQYNGNLATELPRLPRTRSFTISTKARFPP